MITHRGSATHIEIDKWSVKAIICSNINRICFCPPPNPPTAKKRKLFSTRSHTQSPCVCVYRYNRRHFILSSPRHELFVLKFSRSIHISHPHPRSNVRHQPKHRTINFLSLQSLRKTLSDSINKSYHGKILLFILHRCVAFEREQYWRGILDWKRFVFNAVGCRCRRLTPGWRRGGWRWNENGLIIVLIQK